MAFSAIELHMTTRIQLEPEAQAFTEAAARLPLFFNLGPEKGRIAIDELQSDSRNKLPIDVDELSIKDGPSDQVSIRILRPKNAPATLPVMVYIHGGGWVFGNLHMYDRLLREIAIRAETAVVFPEYSLSPEARYPTALEESYSVVKWVAEHGTELGLDPEHLTVGGDGAGGNMTAAITLMAKERGGPFIRWQLLFYPVTNAAFDTESYREFAEGFHLRRDAMMWYWDQYTTNAGERNEITASPLRASIEQLMGLPPALIITAEADVVRDEGEAYANKLREAGVRVTAVRFQGIIHDFVMLNALTNTTAAHVAISLATAWLREGFSTR
jgi:acetyl esterase/lipase